MSKSDAQPGVTVRVRAAQVLLAVFHDYQHLDDAIQKYVTGLGPKDSALLQAICYGVMRWYLTLMFWLELLADRPAKELKPPVRVIILIGLYQLEFMRTPAHAAIHSTVEAAEHLHAKRAKGLINAVLRAYQRRQKSEEPDRQLLEHTQARYAHPMWMLERFQTDWPDSWNQIIESNNKQAPMVIRVDLHRTSIDKYIQQLQSTKIEATHHPVAEAAVVLSKPVAVDLLPGFDEGLVSVQDGAAQLAASLLQHNSQHRVMDACAAPGGKTAHILQLQQPAYLLALDNSKERLLRVSEMLQRIGAKAEVVTGDASTPREWWDGQQFDRILLDAPCSASGVIRRHPDIKYLRTENSLRKIVKRQAKILDSLWQLLNPGGMLLYVTCSIFKIENQEQVTAFLNRHEDASLEEMTGDWGRGRIGRQLLPGDYDMDGFYFAPIRKQ
jgi:16S rRNA (cytosine967-C5)-methyltransferase